MKFILPFFGILAATTSSISFVRAGDAIAPVPFCAGEPKLLVANGSCKHNDPTRVQIPMTSNTNEECQQNCIGIGASYFVRGNHWTTGNRCYCFKENSSCPKEIVYDGYGYFNVYQIGNSVGPSLIAGKRMCKNAGTSFIAQGADGTAENCNKMCRQKGAPYFSVVRDATALRGDKCYCYPDGDCENVATGLVAQASFDTYKTCEHYVSPGANGDPHFTTWGGEKYDFHGECDLVLLQNYHFAEGLGLHIHVRTKIHTWWSSIRSAAIRLGENTLEISGDSGDNHRISYWLDGVEVADMQTRDATLGDYAVHFRRINDHQSQTRLDLGYGNALSIETFKHFVRVNIKAKESPDRFEGSYGMLGAHPKGGKIGRDEETRYDDANEFGQEWQVAPTDPKLFHDDDGSVQHPQKCRMPDATAKKDMSRRLGESLITKEEAAEACAHVGEEDRQSCIYDVMATNDIDMAGSY